MTVRNVLMMLPPMICPRGLLAEHIYIYVAAYAYTDAAIDQAHRAVDELLRLARPT